MSAESVRLHKALFPIWLIVFFLLGGLALAEPEIPWGTFWIDSDSTDIMFNQAMCQYRHFDSSRSEEIISYSGSCLWTFATDVEVKGDAAYVLNVNGLEIYDISDPADPTLVKKLYLGTGHFYDQMDLDGDYLHVAKYDRVHILDVSNPFVPEELSVVILPSYVSAVEVQGDRAYYGVMRYYEETDASPALLIYDVSDPSSPQVVGKYEGASAHRGCRQLVKVGNYIYATNYWDSRLDVISVENETRPVRVDYETIQYPKDVAYHGDYLYVSNSEGIRVYDISTPDDISFQYLYQKSDVTALEVSGNVLYAGSLGDGGIEAFDLTIPGMLDPVGYFDGCRCWYSFTQSGDLLFIPEEEAGFTIADVSDPAQMTKVGDVNYFVGRLRGLDVSGNYAYLTEYMGGAYAIIADVSDKQNPEHISHVFAGGNPSHIFAHDTLFMVAGCMQTMIFSAADPYNPVFLSQYPAGWEQTKGNAARDTVMFVCKVPYLNIVSIADPMNPCLISADSTRYRYLNTALLDGDVLYASALTWGSSNFKIYFQAVDISDIAHPELLGEVTLLHENTAFGLDLAKRGRYVYYTASADGIFVIDVADPSLPDIVNRYNTNIPDP